MNLTILPCPSSWLCLKPLWCFGISKTKSKTVYLMILYDFIFFIWRATVLEEGILFVTLMVSDEKSCQQIVLSNHCPFWLSWSHFQQFIEYLHYCIVLLGCFHLSTFLPKKWYQENTWFILVNLFMNTNVIVENPFLSKISRNVYVCLMSMYWGLYLLFT